MNKRMICFLLGGVLLVGMGILLWSTCLKKDVFLSQESITIYTGYSRQVLLQNYDGICIWISRDPEIAEVSSGTVTAKKEGETQIICRTETGGEYLCQVTVLTSVSERYYEIAKKEVGWLESLQLCDGSFSCYEQEENMKVRVNPYFGSYTALAILKNDHERQKCDKIEDFLKWYFVHMNTEKDIYGTVGTVYDFMAEVEGHHVIREYSLEDYDSADSYAAVFLILLKEYYEQYQACELLIREKQKIDMLVEVLINLKDTVYTQSKNGSGIKYLMNNMEVLQGYKSALILYKELWEQDAKVRRLEDAIKEFEDNFETTWKGESFYYPVLNEENEPFYGTTMQWGKLYEFALPQLFSIVFDAVEQEALFTQTLYHSFCEWWNWTKMDYRNQAEANQTWSIIAYAAMKMEDYKKVDTYLEIFEQKIQDRKYPFYSGDSVWLILTCEGMYEHYSFLEERGEMIMTE